ncbi:hypothetical protein GLAREA_10871 [Glarea lozoyensis ATCC 20868]|uniref:Myb-like domain-containing protein n=2 Tax=Glarea lozoyensis TaxID=101852 RepID=S3DBR9_GLAL2|nr:uncharacterized protein GLAREA_10871 [Glarea lozoyensis ATCC 20868]EHK96450.1 hypothetical protein M7I_7844 [Glarea lozoyensis 74030]EPE35175.1 hypothetical protein GLAREA_10871 [Glarea lozoyensis ATCC 20868]
MSSPINQMNTSSLVAPTNYSPIDAVNRHDFGVQKNRKPASTGGGRAWSEDEEVYLLQTRLQKMPYKHIAAHLKKTELACRLHYHQLSHGSNRRKRTNSVASSNGGSAIHSPVIQTSMPSPISESANLHATSPTYTYSPASPIHVQLPSASSLLPRSVVDNASRNIIHPVAILPKPMVRRTLSDPNTNAPLRLDCGMATNPMNVANVDKDRLRQIYEAHRTSFWGVIAAEYGPGVSPMVLEEAWKATVVSNSPPTPCISPDTAQTGSSYQSYNSKQMMHQLPTPVQENKSSATSISALLGIDASPRSPKEREMIKRMEANRDVVMA